MEMLVSEYVASNDIQIDEDGRRYLNVLQGKIYEYYPDKEKLKEIHKPEFLNRVQATNFCQSGYYEENGVDKKSIFYYKNDNPNEWFWVIDRKRMCIGTIHQEGEIDDFSFQMHTIRYFRVKAWVYVYVLSNKFREHYLALPEHLRGGEEGWN